MIRILIAEEDDRLRLGLHMRLALEPDFVIAGETGDLAKALWLAGAVQPDVLILDVQASEIVLSNSIQQLQQAAPHCKVILLTLVDSPGAGQSAAQAGAAAVVSKRQPDSALIDAVRSAAGMAGLSSHSGDYRAT